MSSSLRVSTVVKSWCTFHIVIFLVMIARRTTLVNRCGLVEIARDPLDDIIASACFFFDINMS